jgi:hypothetical protein
MASENSYPSLQYLYCVPNAAIAKSVPGICDSIYVGLQQYIKVGDENVNKTHFYGVY